MRCGIRCLKFALKSLDIHRHRYRFRGTVFAMGSQWTTSCTRQVLVTSLCLLMVTCDARRDSRALRWLRDPSVDTAHHIDQESDDLVSRDSSSSSSPQSTRTIDLIPRVDGLSFVDDSPRVLRFYSAQQTTRDLAGSLIDTLGLNEPLPESLEGSDRQPEAVGASSERYSVQRIVAGVSFGAGLAISTSVCLVCCRIRGRLGTRLFGRRSANDVTSDVAKPDANDVKEVP